MLVTVVAVELLTIVPPLPLMLATIKLVAKSKLPLLIVTAFEPKAYRLVTLNVPVSMVVGPAYELEAVSVSVQLPDLNNPSVPDVF